MRTAGVMVMGFERDGEVFDENKDKKIQRRNTKDSLALN